MKKAFFLNRKSGLSALNIGVLCGGRSSERKISLKSGKAVWLALKEAGLKATRLDPAAPHFLRKVKRVDVAFLVLHGHGGEDGQIQKFLRRHAIPYTGSGPLASLNAFDKVRAKRLFKKNSVPTADFTVLRKPSDVARLLRLRGPFFAKPVADGSSVGAFAVENPLKSSDKLRQALARFGPLLVEPRIDGREFTVGVLGRKALPVIELLPSRDFFDYKAKYTPGLTRYDVPANIPARLSRNLQRIALKAHQALQLSDFSRVDIMMSQNGEIYVLEANSLPGMTAMSLLPKAAAVSGIAFPELCKRIVRMALEPKPRGKV